MSDYSNRKAEGTGQITSDSLAADSLRDNPSQGFASNERAERGVAPDAVPSRSTTANTTDTSGATQLDPSFDRQGRLTESDLQGQYRTPAQESGLDKFADSRSGGSGTGQSYGSSTGGSQQNAGDAPSVYSAGSRATGDQLKAKGRNIQEVSDFGDAEDAPNASMEYGNDVGGKNDPGRQAEQAFANRAATSAGDAGYPSAGKQGPNINQGGYENLNTDEQA